MNFVRLFVTLCDGGARLASRPRTDGLALEAKGILYRDGGVVVQQTVYSRSKDGSLVTVLGGGSVACCLSLQKHETTPYFISVQ